MSITVQSESRRGCGYRKSGGLYVVAGKPMGEPWSGREVPGTSHAAGYPE